jgi:formate hydrogenlyase subunit 6/NADH:ubiquinone oxidoreductase subunit I
MTEEQIYTNFIEWLGGAWWHLPDSSHLVPMIRAHYSPEEAEFLTGFPFRPSTIDELAQMREVSAVDISEQLEELSRKGMIYESVRGESVRYRLSDSMLALMRANMWSPDADEAKLREVVPLVNAYYLDNWADQWEAAHVKGLRAIPINRTIEDTRAILPYEDVVKYVDEFEFYTVSNCPCRVRHRMDPSMPVCDHPLEVCLHFDDLGRYIVKNNMGREITREETLAILKQSADSGLVHGISTQKERPDTICNCCGCCCLMFEPYHKSGHKGAIRPSNYKVKIDAAACTACALCVKRCPMDALTLKTTPEANNKYGKSAHVDSELCVGCGVCAHKCPAKCMVLEQLEDPTPPPATARDWVMELRKYQQSVE